ncbi:MAG: hypothetical protein AMXMBFR81_29620, partial [Chthonomonas sp.]
SPPVQSGNFSNWKGIEYASSSPTTGLSHVEVRYGSLTVANPFQIQNARLQNSYPVVLARGGSISGSVLSVVSVNGAYAAGSAPISLTGCSITDGYVSLGNNPQGAVSPVVVAAITGNSFARSSLGVLAGELDLRLLDNAFSDSQSVIDTPENGQQVVLQGRLTRAEVSGNSYSGGHRSVWLYGSLACVAVWQRQPGLVFRFEGTPYLIEEGASLTLGAGFLVRMLGYLHFGNWYGNSLLVRGRLESQDSAGNPVVFTHYLDDSPFGGSPPVQSGNFSNWKGIEYAASSPTAGLSHAEVRYGSLTAANPFQIQNARFAYSTVYLNGGGLARQSEFLTGLIANALLIDARWNWWGHNSGPYHSTLNPTGQGSYVSDNVLFHPWLTRGRPVGGMVTLQDYVGEKTSVPVTIELRQPGTTTRVDGQVVFLSASGAFTFNTELVGTFDIVARAPRFLRARATNVVIGEQGVANLSFSLINGDVNGDNTVSIQDFLLVRQAFGSSAGGPAWNPNADLNGDGSVGIADFLILRRNFGRQGQS